MSSSEPRHGDLVLSPHERRGLRLGALLVAAGTVLSGPPMVVLTLLIEPRPAWVDVATMAADHHWLHTLPFWFGFVLLAGNVLFVVAAGMLPALRNRLNPTLAIAFVAMYGGLIGLNYAVQASWLPPALARGDPAVALITMANPESLGWTIEMFGYAFLGAALWLVASGFRGTRLLDAIRYMLIVDGIISIVPVFFMGALAGHILEAGALIGYATWNLLVFVAMVCVMRAYRPALLGDSR